MELKTKTNLIGARISVTFRATLDHSADRDNAKRYLKTEVNRFKMQLHKRLTQICAIPHSSRIEIGQHHGVLLGVEDNTMERWYNFGTT